MSSKNLSLRQVCWAQELLRYLFQIDFYYSEANGTADTFSQYPQQSVEEKSTLQANNTKILHQSQSFLVQVSGLTVLGLELLFPLYQVLICETVFLWQRRWF